MKRLAALILATTVATPAWCETPAAPLPDYHDVSIRDPNVLAAAKFAIGARDRKDGSVSDLKGIQSAEQLGSDPRQYRLCFYIQRLKMGAFDNDEAAVLTTIILDSAHTPTLVNWIELKQCP